MANAKILIVGGGGAGAKGQPGLCYGGGGGAGGVTYSASHALVSGEYPVIVGLGGTGTATASTDGGNGGQSSFDGIVSGGGNGGGANASETGGTSGTPNSYAGVGGDNPRGGGGGSGAAASDTTGGAGTPCDITGTTLFYAGGGGGSGDSYSGVGGSGGGGTGASYGKVPTSGSFYGAGGGSMRGDDSYTSGSGYDGVVIISYLTADFGVCTGGTITTSGDYTVHTFEASGTFTVVPGNPYYAAYQAVINKLPANNDAGIYTADSYSAYASAVALCDLTLTAEDTNEDLETETTNIQTAFDLLVIVPTIEILLVGGGGGGGQELGGGGGGGSVVYNPAYLLSAGEYAVTVGSGGASINNTSVAGNGGDSVFGTITAIGGGGGGGACNGANGGNGGGGGVRNYAPYTGGSGTQGNNGGSGNNDYWPALGAGGGGGTGSVGLNGSTTNGGNGGSGIVSDISGTSVEYGGGGGGGAGSGKTAGTATGGGGAGISGDSGSKGTNGVANTGGGGGGGCGGAGSWASSSGGSGIVIIKYETALFGECTGGTITTDGDYTIHTFTESGTFTLVATYKLQGSAVFVSTLTHSITDYIDSEISWIADLPDGTTAQVLTAVADSTPDEGAYSLCVSGEAIPGISLHTNLSSKLLYIKILLTTSDDTVSPSISNLYIVFTDAYDIRTIILTMDPLKRFNNVEGQLTVNYNGALGSLAGAGGPVASFAVPFTPADLVMKLNPWDDEHLAISLLLTLTATKIYHSSYYSPDEHITASIANIVLTVTRTGNNPL